MQQIQISRGKLSVRNNIEALLNGELFIDYTNGKKYNETDKTFELYAGVNGEAIKIGGQGVLSFIRALTETDSEGNGALPSNPIQGGIYYVTKDIYIKSNSTPFGKDTPEFRAGDLAVYVGEDTTYGTLAASISETSSEADVSALYRADGNWPEEARGWIRINNGGGDAYEVAFDNSNTNYTVTNVQEALVEADRNKLAYGGIKFKKEISTGETAIDGKSVVATGTENFSITKEDLFEYVKAGYYYSIGELTANTNLTIVLSETESLVLEEGDFLSVTSDVTTNDVPLTVDQVTFTKIAGGTHDAGRINYQAGERNETYKNSTDKAWETTDADVKSVKEALDDLFVSKADLTAKGKIPLTQLPDTLINSMEYVGTYTYTGEAADFTLPTAADKNTNISREDEITETELVQGDYFIYTGPQIKIEDAAAVAGKVDSSEGYINSGDWLVYNGPTNNWAVIDNTSPIQSIKVFDNYKDKIDDIINQTTMTGEVKFKGTNRTADNDGLEISETQLEADDKETVTIHNTNAALIADDEKDEDGNITKKHIADIGGFYKENGSKTLIKSGVSETSEGKLVLDESKGIELTGAVTANKGTISETYDHQEGSSITEGDVLKADIIQNPNQGDYGDIELALPSQSGTIARLEDVGLTDGKNFYIPRYKEEANGDVSLVSSPIELIDHTEEGDSTTIVGIKFHGDPTGTITNDSSIIFQKTTESVVHVMPLHSGYILNSNSIIDCGEWENDGLHIDNEGKLNVYTRISSSDTPYSSIDSTEYAEFIKSTATV